MVYKTAGEDCLEVTRDSLSVNLYQISIIYTKRSSGQPSSDACVDITGGIGFGIMVN